MISLLSFCFGVLCILVLFSIVLAVLWALKLRDIIKSIETINIKVLELEQSTISEISDVNRIINDQVTHSHQRMDDIERSTDSKLDKLENRLKIK